MSTVSSFAVVDVETTGFSPKHHHRILEIGIVKVNASGDVIGEFDTLVNPKREVGPTDIHGLRPRDLIDAPTFAEIVGDVFHYLLDSVFVAHNVEFDWVFVQSEMKRAGVNLPDVARACTMDVACLLDPYVPCRNLRGVCGHFEIPINNHHCAISDARAASELLCRFIKTAPPKNLASFLKELGTTDWTAYESKAPTPSGRRCIRKQNPAATSSKRPFLASLVDRLPSYKDETKETRIYYSTLDRALEDRIVSPKEQAELDEIATRYGLLREQVEVIHRQYFLELVAIAANDGIISDEERSDLNSVATVLGIPTDETTKLITCEQTSVACPHGSVICSSPVEFARGSSICFTGEFTCLVNGKPGGRALAEQMAAKHGLVVLPGVVKKLNLLVAADIYSMSTKAQKANKYGIPVISEEEYWRRLGMKSEPTT